MNFSKQQLIHLLSSEGQARDELFALARQVKAESVGPKVYLRGLVEYSNACSKDCYYCGIRASNASVNRYCVEDNDVLQAVRFAHEKGFGSVVLQSGEQSSRAFTERIERLLHQMMEMTEHQIGITLSLGEQKEDTYRRWKEAGALRYLLRVEASNPQLYRRLHPRDHDFQQRVDCLYTLKNLNYQVGTGVMIGLPFQQIDDLADDLLFFQSLDVDMVGMGPYIEHAGTPLYSERSQLLPRAERLDLSLKMVALLRILMPTVNIAATTALQTLDPEGREKAIEVGANVIMPNLTPYNYREKYFLYDGKTLVNDTFDATVKDLEKRLEKVGAFIAYGEQGNSQHYILRIEK